MSTKTQAESLGDAALALALAASALGDLAKAKPPGSYDTGEGPEVTPGGEDEDTAESAPVPEEKATQDPKSLLWDPYAIVEQLGYKDRYSPLTYGTLKQMAYRMPVATAIIQTRIHQVASFCRPQRDRYGIGFKIQLRDSSKSPSKEDLKWVRQMTALIQRTGVTDNPRGRDNFETFCKKLVWDSYVYDQVGVEVVPDREGKPAEWLAVDGATLRIADSASTGIDEDDEEAIRHVQVYDGMVISEYNQAELALGVRNPRTDIRLFGYGISELEMGITTITALLFGFQYNQKQFTQGSIPKGLLNLKGTIQTKQLQAFRRYWAMMTSGIKNAGRMPVLNAEEVQWHPMVASNRDMEYNAWIDFQIKVLCGLFLMDPSEINFKYGNTGQSSAMGEANNKEKIIESKERGLRPMLRFLADIINRFIIWPINESFEFEFVGLDARTHEQIADLNTKQVKSIRTIDELRAEDDLPPLKDGKGDVILDTVYLQNAQAIDGVGEEGEGEGDEAGGEEGDDEDLDDEDLRRLLAGDDDEPGGGKDEDEGPGEDEPDKGAKSRKPGAKGPQAYDSLHKGLVKIEIEL